MARNKELLTKVRDNLMLEDAYFNMGDWFTDKFRVSKVPACGTASCIAGHTLAITNPSLTLNTLLEEGCPSVFTLAKDELGLSEEDANWLFFGEFSVSDLPDIIVTEAIWALNHLINNGNVKDTLGDYITAPKE